MTAQEFFDLFYLATAAIGILKVVPVYREFQAHRGGW